MPATSPQAAALRERLKPSPVRLHHLPTWIKKRIRRRFDLRRWNGLPDMWLLNTYPNPADWVDHWGSTVLPDGSVAFVSEPYPKSEPIAQAVAAFAAELGVEWFITENSEWYPGWTIRIVLWEGPTSTPFDKLTRREIEWGALS